MRYTIISIILGLAFILNFQGCSSSEPPPPPKPPAVTVAKPEVRAVTRYVHFTGYTDALYTVQLVARVEGFLEEIHYEVGSLVKKGDLLFTIDPKPFEARLKKAQANRSAAVSEASLADATFKRNEKAYRKNAVSEIAYLQAKSALATALANQAGAQAAVDDAALDLSYTKILSPVEGKVSRNLIDVGNLVGAGGTKTLLATVVTFDPIYVYFNVDEATFMTYKKNHPPQKGVDEETIAVPVELSLEGQQDFPYKGMTDYIDPTVDRNTGTIQVRALFENLDMFITPGQFAKVRIPLFTDPNTLVVPEVALGADQRGRYLMVVDQDNRAQYRQVTVGQVLADGFAVIDTGLLAEDLVIINGLQRARPGAAVTPEFEDARSKARAEFK